MARFVFYIVLLILLARALARLWGGIMEGLTGGQTTTTNMPQQGVQMVRDPVCGTFIIPDRALTLSVGRQQLYFCSTGCRDKYRARTA
jgi:YHS domain-containing protein